MDENLRVTSNVNIHASYSQDYPATVADAQTERVNVHVEVPEGALPADVRFRMTEVNAESYRQAVEKALGGTTGEILAVDMTFVAPDGTPCAKCAQDRRVSGQSPGDQPGGLSGTSRVSLS